MICITFAVLGFGSTPHATSSFELTYEAGRRIVGTTPTVEGGAPVLLVLPPSCTEFDAFTAFAGSVTSYAVARGYALVMVELPDAFSLPGEPNAGEFCAASTIEEWLSLGRVFSDDKVCNDSHVQVIPMFGSGVGSALSVICSHATIDCDKGVGVAGISLGGALAQVGASDSYGHRVHALLTVAIDVTPPACRHSLPSHKVLALNSATDDYMLQQPATLQQLTGTSAEECGSSLECVATDGSGYRIVEGVPTLPDASAHSSFIVQFLMGGGASWQYETAIQWLMEATRV